LETTFEVCQCRAFVQISASSTGFVDNVAGMNEDDGTLVFWVGARGFLDGEGPCFLIVLRDG
jgi:hypothetical protein